MYCFSEEPYILSVLFPILFIMSDDTTMPVVDETVVPATEETCADGSCCKDDGSCNTEEAPSTEEAPETEAPAAE
jgi:hypothetical protein